MRLRSMPRRPSLTIRRQIGDPATLAALVQELGVRYVLLDRSAGSAAELAAASELPSRGFRALFDSGTVLLLEAPGAESAALAGVHQPG